jgi:tetratricopeptide (TPR) repeat protein
MNDHFEIHEARTLMAEVSVLYERGDIDGAITAANRALETMEETPGNDHPETPSLLGDLAVLNEARGHYITAEALLRRALAIREHRCLQPP